MSIEKKSEQQPFSSSVTTTAKLPVWPAVGGATRCLNYNGSNLACALYYSNLKYQTLVQSFFSSSFFAVWRLSVVRVVYTWIVQCWRQLLTLYLENVSSVIQKSFLFFQFPKCFRECQDPLQGEHLEWELPQPSVISFCYVDGVPIFRMLPTTAHVWA